MAYRSILVPVDGSTTSGKALAAALDLAKEADGRLRLLHLVDDLAYLSGFETAAVAATELRRYAGRVLDQAAAECVAAGVPFDARLLQGTGRRLGDVVAREARDWPADLVVVGTHGRRGIGRLLLGSDAEQVIRLSPVPVLCVR